ncbi:MAG: GGDEF domain-containing protein [Actinomycetota bacterium]
MHRGVALDEEADTVSLTVPPCGWVVWTLGRPAGLLDARRFGDGWISLIPCARPAPSAAWLAGLSPDGAAGVAVMDGEGEAALERAAVRAVRAWRPMRDVARDDALVDRLVAPGAIDVHHQPLVAVESGAVFGFEALARPRVGGLGPAEAISRAWNAGRGPELELACLRAALKSASGRPDGTRLFVNLSGPTVMRLPMVAMESLMLDHGIGRRVLVIEVTEGEAIEDADALIRRMTELRRLGIEVALDDAGTGHATFERIAALRPDYVKLDKVLVKGSDGDRARYALLAALASLGQQIGAQVVAEGVESAHELAAVNRAGIALAQGYGFARPGPRFPQPRGELVEALRGRVRAHRVRGSGIVASDLAECATDVPGDELVEHAVKRFHRDPALRTLVVTDGEGRFAGVVTRETLVGLMSRMYGPALQGKRPVSELCDPEALIVPRDADILFVSEQATARRRDRMYDDIVLVDASGAVAGIIAVRDLLGALADVHARSARDQSPLTGLPGNLVVQEEIARRAGAGVPFAVTHIDLDGFKKINDWAGFAAGDRLIVRLAAAIEVAWSHDPDGFVGHIGGDDFITVASPDGATAAAHHLIGRFEEALAPEMREVLREAGAPRDVAVTVSLATLDCHSPQSSLAEISSRLAHLKARAKALRGSSHCRRTLTEAGRDAPAAAAVTAG